MRKLPLERGLRAMSRLVGRPLGAVYLAAWSLAQVLARWYRRRAARGDGDGDGDGAIW